MMRSYAPAAKLRAAGPFYQSAFSARFEYGFPPPRIVNSAVVLKASAPWLPMQLSPVMQTVRRPAPLTERSDTPVAAAIARPVQCVASPGGCERQRGHAVDQRRRQWRQAGLSVFSRNRPATPSRINRSCQRQTNGFETPARRMISVLPQASAVARMIRARQRCFCGLFRSATTPANCLRRGTHLNADPLAHAASWHAMRNFGIL
jgi:hypothetical protein